MSLLEIKDLTTEVDGKEILKGLNMEIGEGEVHVLMGPNASGKSTLIMTVMGYPKYQITRGKIVFKEVQLNRKPIDERARLGISVAFQSPPEVRGVKLRDLVRIASGQQPWDPFKEKEEKIASPLLSRVGLDPASFLSRDVNVGFSGGEKKRAELAQIFGAKPTLMILDEPDSGVDIESLKTLGNDLGKYIRENKCAALVVTHYRYILPYIRPDKAWVMCDGRITACGDPYEIFTRIEKKGYCEYEELCPTDIKTLIERKERGP